MSLLDEFATQLSSDPNDHDGWADYFEDVAIAKAKRFTDAEWSALDECWRNQNEAWQLRLAGLLGSYSPSRTVPLLEAMVREGSPKVVAEALNSLEGMDGGDFFYRPSMEVRERVKVIAIGVANPVQKATIESLLRRGSGS